MKGIISVLFLLSILTGVSCQNDNKIYDPTSDANQDLKNAIAEAKKQNKNVLVQIGGNWCPWCVKLHHFIQDQPQADSIIKADYVFVRVNYSKENKNQDVLKQLEYPQRFGFPVMVVLNGEGKRLHTQDTGFLEEDGGYSLNKVMTFLKSWNVYALDPGQYN